MWHTSLKLLSHNYHTQAGKIDHHCCPACLPEALFTPLVERSRKQLFASVSVGIKTSVIDTHGSHLHFVRRHLHKAFLNFPL